MALTMRGHNRGKDGARLFPRPIARGNRRAAGGKGLNVRIPRRHFTAATILDCDDQTTLGIRAHHCRACCHWHRTGHRRWCRAPGHAQRAHAVKLPRRWQRRYENLNNVGYETHDDVGDRSVAGIEDRGMPAMMVRVM
jgi:hypothetical protein